MKTKNQTGLKNFKPKINLNHNIYVGDIFFLVTCLFILCNSTENLDTDHSWELMRNEN